MLTYAIRRLAAAIPVLLFSTFVMFWVVSSANDPLAELRLNCPNCSESAYQRLTDLYNLDQPIPQRYVSWLGNAVTGDFGNSPEFGDKPVGPIVKERAFNTLYIAVPASLIVIFSSAVLSMFSALKQYSKGDYATTAFTYLGLALPTFVFALFLQVCVIWLLNSTGLKPFRVQGMRLESIGAIISSITLPILTLIIVSVASDTRFGRTAVLETRNADFIRTARAKGVPERTIVLKHMLRAALIPMVTVWAITFGALLGGAIVTESIFSWPGLGRLLLGGVFNGDVNTTMACVLLIGFFAISFNLIADLLYGWLDPRVRFD